MKNSRRRANPLDEEQVTEEVLDGFKGTEPMVAWMKVLVQLRFARMAHAAVKLRIPDALRTGSKTVRQIAKTTATCELSLHRFLRALCVAGVVKESQTGRFELTPAGALLVSGGKPPFCDALLDFFEPQLVPLDGLVPTIKAGKPVIEQRYGMPFYDYVASKLPDGGARFDVSMNTGAGMRARALLAGVDFSRFQTVVDIGGGEGVLLAKVLEAHSHLRGVVFEREQTAARARTRLANIGFAERCEVISGDFFESVLRGGDAYILAFILHNWDDERCIALLSKCREAMSEDAVLIIVEQILAPAREASIVEYLNLSSLELLSGRERTEPEFRALLKATGFKLTRLIPATENPFSVMEARTVKRRTTQLTRSTITTNRIPDPR